LGNGGPPSDWAEQLGLDDLGDIELVCCPFCGAAAGELRNLHDRAIHSV
jgi:hypothetical protein